MSSNNATNTSSIAAGAGAAVNALNNTNALNTTGNSNTTDSKRTESSSSVNTGVLGGAVAAAFIVGILLGLVAFALLPSRHRNRLLSRQSRNLDEASIEKHSGSGSTPFALYYNDKSNASPVQPQVSIYALSSVVDNLSEEEAVRRLNTINASIAQVASSLAVKASARCTACHTRPPMLPRNGLDEYKVSERSLHFEEMASALIANIMQIRICNASSALGVSNETSQFLTTIEANIGKTCDLITANQWRSVLYKAKDDTRLKGIMHGHKEELHRELCSLLLWCGMEANEQSARRVVNSGKDLLSTATFQLYRLYGDIQTQIVSSRLIIGLDDDSTKLVILSLTQNGFKEVSR